MTEEHWAAESLRYHLAGAALAAGELDLAPIVRSLRKCLKLAPVAPEPEPEPEPVVAAGPLTISNPIDGRSIRERVSREEAQ